MKGALVLLLLFLCFVACAIYKFDSSQSFVQIPISGIVTLCLLVAVLLVGAFAWSLRGSGGNSRGGDVS